MSLILKSPMSVLEAKCSVVGHRGPSLSRFSHTSRCAGLLGRKSTVVRAETEKAESKPIAIDNCDENIGEYCSIDQAGEKEVRTLGEMEQEFLQAMQAWYYDGESIMTDDEFENLKEELIWQGSEIAVLSSAEQKFLEASLAYSKGQQILSDAEYDALKIELKQQDSFVTSAGPRCSLRSRKMYSDLRVDYLKMTLLNIPAVVLVLSGVFLLDDITGFQLTALIELPKPWGALVLWGVVLPACFVLSQQLTNIVLRDGLILKGQCPNCGADLNTYFGDIFTVEGNKDEAEVPCASCKAKLSLSNITREAVVVELPEA
ncbi:hypothetical protein BSKO_13739 [Bryopsis sp. KO-2023]|nr:hypothetical protein BSKO_13739 [Bryopsis sp. KO-2023]